MNKKLTKDLLYLFKLYIESELDKELFDKEKDKKELIEFIMNKKEYMIKDLVNKVIEMDSNTIEIVFQLLNNLIINFKDNLNNVNYDDIIKTNKNNYKLTNAFIYKMILENKKDKNEEYIKLWNEQSKILTTYKNLAYELNINKTLDLANLFSNLLWKGYFSPNKKHVYLNQGKVINGGFDSLAVFQGKGACFNYAVLLEYFLETCGKKATSVNCYVKDLKINTDYKPNINQNISTKEIIYTLLVLPLLLPFLPLVPIKNSIVKKIGNHVITLIDGEKGLYYYDPTNLIVLEPVGPYKAIIKNGFNEITVTHNFTFRLMDNKYINDIIYKLFIENQSYYDITKYEFKNSMEKILDLMNQNISLIDDAYTSIKDNINRINEGINSKRLIKREKNNIYFDLY